MFGHRSQSCAALETDWSRWLITAVRSSRVPERRRRRCGRRDGVGGRRRHDHRLMVVVVVLVLAVVAVILRRFTVTVFVELMMILIGQMVVVVMVRHGRGRRRTPSARCRRSRRNVTEIRRTHFSIRNKLKIHDPKNSTHFEPNDDNNKKRVEVGKMDEGAKRVVSSSPALGFAMRCSPSRLWRICGIVGDGMSIPLPL